MELHPPSSILADSVNKQKIRTIKKIQETIILFLNAQLPPLILRISDGVDIENLGLLPLLKLRLEKIVVVDGPQHISDKDYGSELLHALDLARRKLTLSLA